MMNIIKAVKAVYSCSKEKVQLLDERFQFLWSNYPDPEPVTLAGLEFDAGTLPRLPIRQETFCRLKDSFAVRITPLNDDLNEDPEEDIGEPGKICGYLLVIYDLEDVQRIYTHSAKYKEQSVLMGNLRSGLSSLNLTAEKLQIDPLYYSPDASRRITAAVLKTLSMSTNQSIVDRIYSGKVKPSAVQLSTELSNSAGETARWLDSEFCHFTAEIAADICIRANWYLIESAVLNLVINAYMYSDAVVKLISLSLERRDGQAVVTVSDNGTNADIPRIEKLSYYRTRKIEFREQEGLGLPIARLTAENFGGSIAFGKSPTGGLAVSLSFPCPDEKEFSLRSENRRLPFFPFEYQLCILSKGKDIYE